MVSFGVVSTGRGIRKLVGVPVTFYTFYINLVALPWLYTHIKIHQAVQLYESSIQCTKKKPHIESFVVRTRKLSDHRGQLLFTHEETKAQKT